MDVGHSRVELLLLLHLYLHLPVLSILGEPFQMFSSVTCKQLFPVSADRLMPPGTRDGAVLTGLSSCTNRRTGVQQRLSTGCLQMSHDHGHMTTAP